MDSWKAFDVDYVVLYMIESKEYIISLTNVLICPFVEIIHKYLLIHF